MGGFKIVAFLLFVTAVTSSDLKVRYFLTLQIVIVVTLPLLMLTLPLLMVTLSLLMANVLVSPLVIINIANSPLLIISIAISPSCFY